MTETERMLPLYEAKMIHHFNPRWSTFDDEEGSRDPTDLELQDPEFRPMPRFWVRESVVDDALRGKWEASWVLGSRMISNSTNERSFICTELEKSAFGNGCALVLNKDGRAILQGLWSSFAFDYVVRQKMGGSNMNFFVTAQLPTLAPSAVDHVRAHMVQLVDTLNRWDLSESARVLLRAELDALSFHLYGIERGDVAYIMDTFPIVKRKDVAAHGEYRTKRMILEIYDEMSEAIANGTTYVSPFDEEVSGE